MTCADIQTLTVTINTCFHTPSGQSVTRSISNMYTTNTTTTSPHPSSNNRQPTALQSFQVRPGALFWLPPRSDLERRRKAIGKKGHGVRRIDNNGDAIFSKRVFGQVVIVLERGGDGRTVRFVVARRFGEVIERVREVRAWERGGHLELGGEEGDGGFWYVYAKEVFEVEWEYLQELGEEEGEEDGPLILVSEALGKLKELVGRVAMPLGTREGWRPSVAEEGAWKARLRALHMSCMRVYCEDARYGDAVGEALQVLRNAHWDFVGLGLALCSWALSGGLLLVQVLWNGLLVLELGLLVLLDEIATLKGKLDEVYLWLEEKLSMCRRAGRVRSVL